MNIVSAKSCEGLAHKAYKFLQGVDVDIANAVRDMTLHIGPASDPAYQTPAHARDCIAVCDGSHLGQLIASTQVKALYKQDPKAVRLTPKWNGATKKWDMMATAIQKGTNDALPNLIDMQGIAPWSQNFFQDIFERPLLYSHAKEFVKKESGTNPWAEVMNLMMADYGGSAIGPRHAGSADNSMNKDVTVTAGFMSAMVVNMFVTYSFTVEEQEAANTGSGNPYGAQMMTKKVQYADYVLQMLTDYLTYYGNNDTDTQGLLQVNPVTAWTGGSIKSIVQGSGTTKGSILYQKVTSAIDDFVHSSYNKFDHIKVGMSTYAYNKLRSVPYSDNYSAESPFAVFEKNYNIRDGKTDNPVTFEFFADPLLDANTDFNPQAYDYLVITAPEVGTGPKDTRKSVILQGMPLEKFVYPVIPGMVNTQHRMLRKYAGVYAPVKESVKVYSGFGEDGTE